NVAPLGGGYCWLGGGAASTKADTAQSTRQATPIPWAHAGLAKTSSPAPATSPTTAALQAVTWCARRAPAAGAGPPARVTTPRRGGPLACGGPSEGAGGAGAPPGKVAISR